MEDKARCENIRDLIVDPEKFLPDLNEERVRMLLMELDMLKDDFERERAIMYLASNYSCNKHLSFSVLRGMHDTEIFEIMDDTRGILVAEIESRKKNHH
jgi:hypothetical protein